MSLRLRLDSNMSTATRPSQKILGYSATLRTLRLARRPRTGGRREHRSSPVITPTLAAQVDEVIE
jgi:hypothetical protein